MDTYENKYKEALERAKKELNVCSSQDCDAARQIFRLFPELKESEDEKIRKWIIDDIRYNIDNEPLNNSEYKKQGERAIAWLEKQESEPNWCHHKVDLSNCSEEYRKAYYDGWNNCNMQHSQCESEKSDVLKCLINGMKFYYEDNEEATWGTEKFSMKIKDILSWLEKQGKQKPILDFKARDWYVNKIDSKIHNIYHSVDKVEPKFKVGNVLCDKSCTTLSKEAQSNFEITDIRNGMYICDKCSFPISQQDEYELVAKRIEQKPTDKVEPKFHEGEWITNGDYTWKIVEVKPLDYILQSQDGNIVDDTISHVDEQFHSFTIQDAKEGDVLYINNTMSESIMIYKSFNNGVIDKYASCSKFGFEGENYLTLNGGYIIPATKEQRTELFLKMHEAGYEWDAENKQLNKIYIVHDTYCQENCKGFQETGKCFADGECKAKEEAEQKLVESEDEKIRKGLIGMLSKYKYVYSKEIAWLKKQGKPSDEDMKTLLRTEYEKGRADAIAEMQKEWSEEDLYMQKQAIKCINNSGKLEVSTEEIEDWLKSLKLQSKQEWNEEDSYYRNHIIQIIEEINNAPLKRGEDWDAYINWLKSLRPKNK